MLSKLQLRLLFFVKGLVVLVERAWLLLGLLRLLRCRMVAQSKSEEKLFEVFVFWMWLLKKLIGCRWLEAIQDLCLVRQILKCLSVVFIARFRWVLTFYIVDSVTIHLLSVLIFLIVAQEITDFKCSHITKIGVQKGWLWANNRVNLTKSLHSSEVSKIDMSRYQIYVP